MASCLKLSICVCILPVAGVLATCLENVRTAESSGHCALSMGSSLLQKSAHGNIAVPVTASLLQESDRTRTVGDIPPPPLPQQPLESASSGSDAFPTSFIEFKESTARPRSIWVHVSAVVGLVLVLGVVLIGVWKSFIEDPLGNSMAERDDRYDDQEVVQSIRSQYGPWQLLLKMAQDLSRFWVVLAIMYWAIFQDSGALLNCDDPTHSGLVRHVCQYTKACLYGYSILAANVTLVLTVRILVQMQFYYSMLQHGCIVDFVNIKIMNTAWPWICLSSMLTGGMHFVLKMYLAPGVLDLHGIQSYALAGNKFILPGILFMSFFPHFAEVENSLVTLSCIMEKDYTKRDRKSPWLAKLQAMNARVLAWDVRTNDVVKRTCQGLDNKECVSISDVMKNMMAHYEDVYKKWLLSGRNETGMNRERAQLFREMWPAAVLGHHRMDWEDPDTRQWLYVITIVGVACATLAMLSLFALFGACYSQVSPISASMWRLLFNGGIRSIPTDKLLFNVVLTGHGMIVIYFIYKSVLAMFYQQITKNAPHLAITGIVAVMLLCLGVASKMLYE